MLSYHPLILNGVLIATLLLFEYNCSPVVNHLLPLCVHVFRKSLPLKPHVQYFGPNNLARTHLNDYLSSLDRNAEATERDAFENVDPQMLNSGRRKRFVLLSVESITRTSVCFLSSSSDSGPAPKLGCK